jgi:hypothetical protein
MFQFTAPLPMRLIDHLLAYLEEPEWCHAEQMGRMIVHAPPARGVPDERRITATAVQNSVEHVLNRWTAYRNHDSAEVEDPRGILRRHVGPFILGFQDLPGFRLFLSDVPEGEILAFARTVRNRCFDFGALVKGRYSGVLGSKTAHFFYPGLVPAYDQKVIRFTVLPRLAWGCSDMRSYVVMCWWVLQQYIREGTLEEARDVVAEFVLDRTDWMGLAPNHWLLRSLDSVIAEYTLIQLSRTAGDRYVLQRVFPRGR